MGEASRVELTPSARLRLGLSRLLLLRALRLAIVDDADRFLAASPHFPGVSQRVPPLLRSCLPLCRLFPPLNSPCTHAALGAHKRFQASKPRPPETLLSGHACLSAEVVERLRQAGAGVVLTAPTSSAAGLLAALPQGGCVLLLEEGRLRQSSP